jgi:hypothetical protein
VLQRPAIASIVITRFMIVFSPHQPFCNALSRGDR